MIKMKAKKQISNYVLRYKNNILNRLLIKLFLYLYFNKENFRIRRRARNSNRKKFDYIKRLCIRDVRIKDAEYVAVYIDNKNDIRYRKKQIQKLKEDYERRQRLENEKQQINVEQI